MPDRTRWHRIILHADMDAFYASVEQHDDPALRGRPVLVGGKGRRSVVAAASYEARPFGCRSAMPMGEALRRCPDAVVVTPRIARYAEVSACIMNVFHDFSPLVEPLSLDEAFLDMTGSLRLFGPPDEMGRRLKAAVREATDGLTISVGASVTKFVAKVASDLQKPNGLTVVAPGDVRSFLAPLPVSRLWGVGEKTLPRLQELGLACMGDVAAAPPHVLRTLGSLGDHLRRLAVGDDPREVIPDRDPKSVGAEVTLEHDAVGAAALRPHLLRAADTIARRLRADGWVAGGVRVKLKTARFLLCTRQSALRAPTDAASEILEAVDHLLGDFDLTIPMRLVGLAAYDLRPNDAPIQADLFLDAAHARTQRLDQTVDALKARFGKDAVRRASDLDDVDRAGPDSSTAPKPR